MTATERAKHELAMLEYIANMQGKTFVWGENDCLTFATGAFLAYSGVDLFKPYRNKYNSQNSAENVLNGRTIEQMVETEVAKHENVVELPELTAGDPALVVVEIMGKQFGAFYTGMTIQIFQNYGLQLVGFGHVKRCWGVIWP